MNTSRRAPLKDSKSTNVKPPVPKPKSKTLAEHRPETDILLWLQAMHLCNFQNLADLRYTLYHRCSRAGFTVKRWDKDDFKLTGRSSSLHIVSNEAFSFLWRLRILAIAWALPRSRATLTKPSLLWLVEIMIGSALTARMPALPAKRTIRNSPLK